MEKKIKVKFSGTAVYPQVHFPSKGSGNFEVPVVVNDDVKEFLEANGAKRTRTNFKNPDGTFIMKSFEEFPGAVFTLRRVKTTRDGKELDDPIVVDSEGNTIPKTTLIGNGSKVTVTGVLSLYENKYGQQGTLLLNHLQVDELVKFEHKEKEEILVAPGTVGEGSVASKVVDDDII